MAGRVGVCASSASCQTCGRAFSSWVLMRQDSLSRLVQGSQDPEAPGLSLWGAGAGSWHSLLPPGHSRRPSQLWVPEKLVERRPFPSFAPGAQARW